MIYMWFTGINYYKLAVEKDHDSIFTTMWKPGFMINQGSTNHKARSHRLGATPEKKRSRSTIVLTLCEMTVINFLNLRV